MRGAASRESLCWLLTGLFVLTAPRQSLPLSFPNLAAAAAAGQEDEDEEASPSIRPLVAKRMRASVGGALETTRRASVKFGDAAKGRALLSSSDDDEDEDAEPVTRTVVPRRRRRLSSSSSATSSESMLGTPTRGAPRASAMFAPRASMGGAEQQQENAEERPGRFEREYADVAELGAGEFGQVLRAQRRADGAPCAIKRSKRFEGAKHRCVCKSARHTSD